MTCLHSCFRSIGPPASLAEQLKQVLAEREKRLAGDIPSVTQYASNQPPNPVVLTQNLVEEIRQAVNEANARGIFIVFLLFILFIMYIFIYIYIYSRIKTSYSRLILS